MRPVIEYGPPAAQGVKQLQYVSGFEWERTSADLALMAGALAVAAHVVGHSRLAGASLVVAGGSALAFWISTRGASS